MDIEVVEVKRQLWIPRNGNGCLHPVWVLAVYNSVGEFTTYRCEDTQKGNTFCMAPTALTGFFEPTEQFEIVE